MDALLKMELEVDAHYDLHDQHKHDDGDEFGVNVLAELSALVFVAKEVADDSKDRTGDLDGDVPL